MSRILERAGAGRIVGCGFSLLRQLAGVVAQFETVIDPFAGSGTTSVACLMLGRRCILIDQSMELYQISKRRLLAVEKLEGRAQLR